MAVEAEALMANFGLGFLGAMIAGMFMFFLIFAIAWYVYSSLTLMLTAKRLKVDPPWLAWIPIANLFLLPKMAKMPWWPILLLIAVVVPVVNILALIAFAIFYIIWLFKICEARKKPGWFAILTIVPVIGGVWSLILWGLLAWSD